MSKSPDAYTSDPASEIADVRAQSAEGMVAILTAQKRDLERQLREAHDHTTRAVDADHTAHTVTGAARSLAKLRQLKPGWDSYGGKAPTREALHVAETVALWAPQVVPMSHGGVQLEWHVNGVDLEIEIKPDCPAVGALTLGGE
jgi:hypothetical protein